MKHKAAEVGAEMWLHLDRAFLHVLAENDLQTKSQRAQAWVGFLAAAGGAMVGDIGEPDAVKVLALVTKAIEGLDA